MSFNKCHCGLLIFLILASLAVFLYYIAKFHPNGKINGHSIGGRDTTFAYYDDEWDDNQQNPRSEALREYECYFSDSFNCNIPYGRRICIRKTSVCDGIKDCPNNKDEEDCVPDVNECLTDFPCDQICKDKRNGFECSCKSGYSLETDKISCKAEGALALMLFSNGTEIEATHVIDEVKWKVVKNFTEITSYSYNHADDSVYFTSDGCIYKASLDRSKNAEKISFEGVDSVNYLMVDWFGDKLYLSAEVDFKQYLIVCHMVKNVCTKLLDMNGRVTHMESDFNKRYMFWMTEPEFGIDKAGLDGSEWTTLQTTENCMTFALYHALEKIFWRKAYIHGTIYYSSYDGSGIKELSIKAKVSDSFVIENLAVWSNRIYFAKFENDKRTIVSCSLRNCSEFKIEHAYENEAYISGVESSILIDHPIMYKEVDDVCSSRRIKCSHICLLSPSNKHSYTCKCPEGHKLDLNEHHCKNKCEENNGNCDHKCQFENATVTCSCLSGYQLKSDEKTCEDINECDDPDSCHHICSNTIGSFNCSCQDGYKLEDDNNNCVRTDPGLSPSFGIIQNSTFIYFQSSSSGEVKIEWSKTFNFSNFAKMFTIFDKESQTLYIVNGTTGSLFIYRNIEKFQDFDLKAASPRLNSTLKSHNSEEINHIESPSDSSETDGPEKHNLNVKNIKALTIEFQDQNIYMVTGKYTYKKSQYHNSTIFYQSQLEVYSIKNRKKVLLSSIPSQIVTAVKKFSEDFLVTCECFWPQNRVCSLVFRDLLGNKWKTLVTHRKMTCSSIVNDPIKTRIFWIDEVSDDLNIYDDDDEAWDLHIGKEFHNKSNLAMFKHMLLFSSANGTLASLSLKDGAFDVVKKFETNFTLIEIEENYNTNGSLCSNGSCAHVCINRDNEPTCLCEPGYIPLRNMCIEKDSTKTASAVKGSCDANPCKNGLCEMVSRNYFVCRCFENYHGKVCSIYASRSKKHHGKALITFLWILNAFLFILVALLIVDRGREESVFNLNYFRQFSFRTIPVSFPNPVFSYGRRSKDATEESDSTIDSVLNPQNQEMEIKYGGIEDI